MMPDLESLGSIWRAVAGVAFLLAAARVAGGFAVRLESCAGPCRPGMQLLGVVVGLNLVGFLGIVLGMAGWLRGARSVWLLMGLGILLLRALAGRPINWKRPPNTLAKFARPRPLRLGLFAAVCMFVLITLLPALCPPSGWDELVYHEVLPQRWLASGGPAIYADLPYSGFPALGEILFWLIAPLEHVIAPRLLSWTCWILGLACLFRVLRRWLATVSAVLLTLAFAISETSLLISQNCYAETLVLMNIAALMFALGKLRRASGVGSWRLPLVLGLLVGGTAAVKLTGCAALAVPCIWYLGAMWHACGRRRALGLQWAIAMLTAFATAFPFYLRPWLATGNPFYPYLCWWFTGDPATIAMSRHHHAIGGIVFGVRNPAAFFDGPLLLAFRADNYDGCFGWQLVLFFALAIAALIALGRGRRRSVVACPAAVALWFYVFWFVTSQQARFAVPSILALVVLAGLGLQRLRGVARQVALLLLCAVAVACVPWEFAGYYWYSGLAVVGRVNRSDYIHNMTDLAYMPMVQAIDALTPEDAKVLLLYEHRGFYIPRRSVIGTPLFQAGPFTLPEQYSECSRILQSLRDREVTHVVLPKVVMGPDQSDEWFERQKPFLAGIDQCVLEGRLRPVWQSEMYLLVEVPRK